jgi:hypothetical protein
MRQDTGRIYTTDEVKLMGELEQLKCHSLPAETAVDTIYKLQKPTLAEKERRAALKALNRNANKMARKARRRNRQG